MHGTSVRVMPWSSKDCTVSAFKHAEEALEVLRGAPALDVGALADLIVAIGRIMSGNPRIREIDLNPVIIHPQGEGVVALDALMLVEG